MGRLTTELMDFFGLQSAQCLFCDKVAGIEDGRLTRSDFVYWHQRDLLVLCEECAATYLPRLIADIARQNPDLTWERATATFWRALANQRRDQPPKDPDSP